MFYTKVSIKDKVFCCLMVGSGQVLTEQNPAKRTGHVMSVKNLNQTSALQNFLSVKNEPNISNVNVLTVMN